VQGISKVELPLSLLLAGCMWFYVQHILIAHQLADAALHGTPRGNLSDLYPRWLGARELLLHHRDPYSRDLTREIQMGYYGRVLDPARTEDPTDKQAFAYPVYVVFLLAPTVTLPFAVVQAGFRWFLIFLIVATVPLWLRVLRWRPSTATTAAVVVLTLGSFPVLQGIKLQQLSLLVGGVIAGCVVLLDGGSFFLAGVLLALATIKPQLVLLVAAWLLLWAMSGWSRRTKFVWGFFGTLAILCGAGEYVLPGWLGRFREALIAYRLYNGGTESVLDVLVTPSWGRVLAALALLALLLVGWRVRRAPSDSPAFRWMLVLTLAVTVVVVPKAAPYNQVLLLPGILLAAQQWQVLWTKNRLTRIIALLACVLIFWPWLAAVTLTVASLFLPNESVQKAWALPVYTSLVIPIAVVAVLSFCLSDLARFEPRVSESPRT
jgi:hypothetical protein